MSETVLSSVGSLLCNVQEQNIIESQTLTH